MAKQPAAFELTESDARARLSQGLNQVRGWGGQGLAGARALAAVKLATQRRELERLRAKLGRDDPRVAALAGDIDSDAGVVQQLATLADRAATLATPPEPDRWIVHGHVTDRSGQPVAGATVGLYDESGALVEKFGYGETDQRGYFKLVNTETSEERAAPRPGPLDNERPQEPAKPAAERARLAVGVKVGDRPLSINPAPLAREAGRIEYRDVRLTRGRAAPPPSRRDPNTARKARGRS